MGKKGALGLGSWQPLELEAAVQDEFSEATYAPAASPPLAQSEPPSPPSPDVAEKPPPQTERDDEGVVSALFPAFSHDGRTGKSIDSSE